MSAEYHPMRPPLIITPCAPPAVHAFPTDEDGGFDLGCSKAVTGGLTLTLTITLTLVLTLTLAPNPNPPRP